jgi:hypothetical protein
VGIARAADQDRIAAPKFAGSASCASSSCHGGGAGRDQTLTWIRKDVHAHAQTLLANARSARLAETLKIEDATKSARCNVCHSPMQTLPSVRLVKDGRRDEGVSCETCHGASEPWILFHTRPDVNHAQRVAAGMRELGDFNARATACIACHMNIDIELVRAGHPEMFFELDGQVAFEPPHWKDEGTWIGPRAWLTGQAAALRELSWKLTRDVPARPEKQSADELRIEGLDDTAHDLLPRWKAVAWLLRKTTPGAQLPETSDFRAMQGAADHLARNAARLQWSKETTNALLHKYAGLAKDFRDSKADVAELRRRGEVLLFALDRLWSALKTEAAAASPEFDAALLVVKGEARTQTSFDPARFAAALEQTEVALELMK